MKRTAAVLSVFSLAVGLAAPAQAQLAPQSKSPIDVTGDQLEAENAQCLLIYRGNVEALQDTSRLRTDQLELYAAKAGESHAAGATGMSTKCGGIERIEAHGSVYYVTPSQVVKGDDAIYLADEKTITITGDVVVSQGKNVVVGSRLVINTDTEQATMDGASKGAGKAGRVRSVIYPGQNQGALFQSAAPASH